MNTAKLTMVTATDGLLLRLARVEYCKVCAAGARNNTRNL